MAERFSHLPEEGRIFRLAEPGSFFLPADAELPLPAWFQPSSGDEEEGALRSRVPGLSVWDGERTTVMQVCSLLARPAAKAFGLKVQTCKQIGQVHQRELAVVADPLDSQEPKPGWDAHSLIEGLKRPPSVTKQAHRDLLTDLSRACHKID